jgi:hypothetical protein
MSRSGADGKDGSLGAGINVSIFLKRATSYKGIEGAAVLILRVARHRCQQMQDAFSDAGERSRGAQLGGIVVREVKSWH